VAAPFVPGGFDGIHNALYDHLMYVGLDGKPVGQLATDWKVAADAKSMTIKLREGVKWHDGKDFTADDVVFLFKYCLDPKNAAFAGDFGELIGTVLADIKATDKFNVAMTFKNPAPYIYDVIDYMYMGRFVEGDDQSVKNLPIGTGPFKMTEKVPDAYYKFVKWDGYWDKALPYLDGITFKGVADPATMIQLLKAKDIDGCHDYPPSDVAGIEKDTTLQTLHNDAQGSMRDFLVNCIKPPFNDIKVRQALSYSMNRQAFVTNAYFGSGAPICSAFYKASSPAYNKDLLNRYPFDLTQARKLLDSAGVPATWEWSTYSCTLWPEDKLMMQIWQSDLAKIGVKMTFQDVAWAKFRSLLSEPYDFTIIPFGTGRAGRDPHIFLLTQGQVTNADGNQGWLPKLTDAQRKLINDASVEGDPAKRATMYQSINKMLTEELLFQIPMRSEERVFALQKYVQGWYWQVKGFQMYDKVWLNK